MKCVPESEGRALREAWDLQGRLRGGGTLELGLAAQVGKAEGKNCRCGTQLCCLIDP